MSACIDRETLFPIGERKNIQRSKRGNAGVADDDVYAAICADSLVESTLNVGLFADIQLECQRLTEALDLGSDFPCALQIDIGNDDVRALFCESQRDRAADSTGRSGDHCHLSGQLFFFRQQGEFVELERPIFGVEGVVIAQRLVPARRFRPGDDPHRVAVDVADDSRGARIFANRPHPDARLQDDARRRVEHRKISLVIII